MENVELQSETLKCIPNKIADYLRRHFEFDDEEVAEVYSRFSVDFWKEDDGSSMSFASFESATYKTSFFLDAMAEVELLVSVALGRKIYPLDGIVNNLDDGVDRIAGDFFELLRANVIQSLHEDVDVKMATMKPRVSAELEIGEFLKQLVEVRRVIQENSCD